MGKTPQLRRAETDRFKQRRVAQAVRDDAVIFAHQGGNHRLIRGKTGDKQQRPRVAQPVGQLFLQRLMRRGVAADVPGATAAHAVTIRALLPRERSAGAGSVPDNRCWRNYRTALLPG